MTKQAYEKIRSDLTGTVIGHIKLDLLPECKRESRLGVTYEYQKARKYFLGLIPYTIWVDKNDIAWFPEETVEYYKCSCGEEE